MRFGPLKGLFELYRMRFSVFALLVRPSCLVLEQHGSRLCHFFVAGVADASQYKLRINDVGESFRAVSECYMIYYQQI